MNQMLTARNFTVLISPFNCLCVRVCVHNLCVYMHVYTYIHGYVHTNFIASISSFKCLYTCLCVHVHILKYKEHNILRTKP